MSLSTSMVVLMVAALLAVGLLQRVRSWQRATAARLEEGQPVRRSARSVPARLMVERGITGGPPGGGVNVLRADLTLGETIFVLATHHGRVLEISAARPGTATTTGPRRLVVEGTHPSGASRVRAELIIDDPEGWARDVGGLHRSA